VINIFNFRTYTVKKKTKPLLCTVEINHINIFLKKLKLSRTVKKVKTLIYLRIYLCFVVSYNGLYRIFVLTTHKYILK